MKTNVIRYLWVLMILGTSLYAQQNQKQQAQRYLNLKGEVIFDIKISDPGQISTLTRALSIVNYDKATGVVKVMANQNQFTQFLEKEIPFTITEKDNIVGYQTMTSDLSVKAATFPLTAYPTYADYVSIMNDFAANYPAICKVENIGATTEGDKALLFVKLSDNVNQNEQEPRVMYTSSMHGDEIAGYPMMLNLIDFLLNAYSNTSDPRHAEIKQLLDNNEVWINPLANPDGTYRNSANNTSVANATRGNANNVDLNRNYPDPDDGPNPDGNATQIETQHFINFAQSRHFVLSANFHGGIEVINYPWDTYAAAHPDEDYFIHISEEYRDFCQQNSPAGYFDALNNGITNGYDWYEVQGGRQDYQIYYHKGREVTVELSNAKTPAASQLVNFWNYNKEALIGFLKQVNYGLRGTVTDAVTNVPIAAKVTVIGKDGFDTWTPTELPEGDYYRPIKAGTYSIKYEADCYETVTLTGVTIADYQAVIRDVQLNPVGAVAPSGLSAGNVQASSATLSWDAAAGASYDLRYRQSGTSSWTVIPTANNTVNLTGLIAEVTYEAQVRSKCSSGAASPYSTSITFTTTAVPACAGIASFPYTESFETGLGVWTNDSGDDINWTRDSNGTPSSSTGPSTGQDGSFYLFTEASGNNSGYPNKVALLSSPCIDLSNLDGAAVTFGYHMYGSNMGTMELELSTDNGSSYSSIWTVSGNQGNEWKTAELDLSAYSGDVIRLRFKGTTGNGFRSDMAIDNIRIQSVVPDTQAPSTPLNLTANNITGNSVGLSWSASTDNVGVSGYEIYQDGNLVNTVTTTAATVGGLSPDTQYNFYIIAKDAAGNASAPGSAISVTTTDISITYCNSQGNNVNDEYIDYVGIGGIDNTTAATSGYSDYTNLTGNVAYGSNTITLSLNYTGTVYTEYWGVWIDFDKSGTFDTSELVVTASTRSEAIQTYNFTVPATAQSGPTRMRVSLKYNAAPGPCETFAYGEVEDYTVNIGASVVKNNTKPDTDLSTVTLYPNPVKHGMVYLEGVQKSVYVTIYNHLGQEVISSKKYNQYIDVSGLPSGLYIAKVHNTETVKSLQFLIE